jgi:TPR repeat protein
MYSMGRGTEANGAEAERWLKLSTEAGFAEAGSVLGMAYAIGKAGVKRNIALARKLLSQTAGIRGTTISSNAGDDGQEVR